MTCLRCEGLMVHEKFEDLDGLWSSDHEFTGWRCLNCGAIPAKTSKLGRIIRYYRKRAAEDGPDYRRKQRGTRSV
jgi:hypothetical protein